MVFFLLTKERTTLVYLTLLVELSKKKVSNHSTKVPSQPSSELWLLTLVCLLHSLKLRKPYKLLSTWTQMPSPPDYSPQPVQDSSAQLSHYHLTTWRLNSKRWRKTLRLDYTHTRTSWMLSSRPSAEKVSWNYGLVSQPSMSELPHMLWSPSWQLISWTDLPNNIAIEKVDEWYLLKCEMQWSLFKFN